MAILSKIPKEERPRERLISLGADALSLTELLAICLGSGRKGKSVLSLAEELLSLFGTLHSLFQKTVEELMTVKGIGYAKAVQLKAIFAIAKKYSKPVGLPKYKVKAPEDVYLLITSIFPEEKREVLFVFLRDIKGNIFHHEILSIGTLSEVLIHPREVFSCALAHRAHSIIIAHNHPSNDLSPSKQDLELTKILYSSGRLMGIRLDDHLIVTVTGFVSLWEKGYLPHAQRY